MPREMKRPGAGGAATGPGLSKRAPGLARDTPAPAEQRPPALFEQEHGRLVWRIDATEWNGQPRVQVWPWFPPKEGGGLRPCAARFGGGFAIPLERLPELIAALTTIAAGKC
jgi:hypothetical protein